MVTARGVRALCGVLNRLRASPWVRAGLLTVVLVFCGYGLAVDWPQVHPALGRLHWYSISGAALAAVAGAGCMMLAWREVLADLGTRLAAPAACRIMFVAQLAKYVPGAVWAFAAQQYWWALAIAPLILIGLCPPVLGRLLDRALTLVRWQPLERRPSVRGVA